MGVEGSIVVVVVGRHGWVLCCCCWLCCCILRLPILTAADGKTNSVLFIECDGQTNLLNSLTNSSVFLPPTPSLCTDIADGYRWTDRRISYHIYLYLYLYVSVRTYKFTYVPTGHWLSPSSLNFLIPPWTNTNTFLPFNWGGSDIEESQ